MKCKQQVFRNAGWHSGPCSRNAWKDGYCKQHHPDTVAARDKARHEKFDLESKIRSSKWEKITAYDTLYAALFEIANLDGSRSPAVPLTIAQRALKKVGKKL